MPQGLQCWNASGQKTLDTNYRTAKILAVIPTGSTSGSYTWTGDLTGELFAALSGSGYIPPSVSVSGRTVTWTIGSRQSSGNLIIGCW